MLPTKKGNIYPKNEENLKALISFYFDKFDMVHGNVILYMVEKTSLSLNEFEFIAKNLAEAYAIHLEKSPYWKFTMLELIEIGFNGYTGLMVGKVFNNKQRILIEEFLKSIDESK